MEISIVQRIPETHFSSMKKNKAFSTLEGKIIHHLHASAQISERIVNEIPGPWDNTSLIWGYSVDWYANEIG